MPYMCFVMIYIKATGLSSGCVSRFALSGFGIGWGV